VKQNDAAESYAKQNVVVETCVKQAVLETCAKQNVAET